MKKDKANSIVRDARSEYEAEMRKYGLDKVAEQRRQHDEQDKIIQELLKKNKENKSR